MQCPRERRPFFMHRLVQQQPSHARLFNDAVYLLLAAAFLIIGGYFVFSVWTSGEVRFNPIIMLPFFALLCFANLSTVIAAYPSETNLSFNAETKWSGFAGFLYPVATWSGLAGTVIMLGAWLLYQFTGGAWQRAAAIAWAAGLLLSTPTLAYRMLFIRTLIPWERK